MVKLSSYSNGYDNKPIRLTPWEFWTDEEKSHVIYEAYRGHYLESAEVKKYLDISRKHMYTQFLVPALVGVGYFGFLKDTVFKGLYRKSPYYGLAGGVALIAATTIYWLNESPFFYAKENAQEKMLETLYHKIGTSMKALNDCIPRTTTSTQIDRRTRQIYSERHGPFAGILYAEDDFAPLIRDKNRSHDYNSKKIFL